MNFQAPGVDHISPTLHQANENGKRVVIGSSRAPSQLVLLPTDQGKHDRSLTINCTTSEQRG